MTVRGATGISTPIPLPINSETARYSLERLEWDGAFFAPCEPDPLDAASFDFHAEVGYTVFGGQGDGIALSSECLDVLVALVMTETQIGGDVTWQR